MSSSNIVFSGLNISIFNITADNVNISGPSIVLQNNNISNNSYLIVINGNGIYSSGDNRRIYSNTLTANKRMVFLIMFCTQMYINTVNSNFLDGIVNYGANTNIYSNKLSSNKGYAISTYSTSTIKDSTLVGNVKAGVYNKGVGSLITLKIITGSNLSIVRILRPLYPVIRFSTFK